MTNDLNEQHLKQVEDRLVDVYLMIKNRAVVRWCIGVIVTLVVGLFGGTLVIAWTSATSIRTMADKILNPVPVGTILAWHKNPNPDDKDTELELPTGWLECDGQSIPDDSPLKKITGAENLPNLNDPNMPNFLGNKGGGGAFLRGGTNSGVTQPDSFQGHGHHFRYHSDSDGAGDKPIVVKMPTHKFNKHTRNDVVTFPVKGKFGEVRVDSETRPINISVVWIMRVK